MTTASAPLTLAVSYADPTAVRLVVDGTFVDNNGVRVADGGNYAGEATWSVKGETVVVDAAYYGLGTVVYALPDGWEAEAVLSSVGWLVVRDAWGDGSGTCCAPGVDACLATEDGWQHDATLASWLPDEVVGGRSLLVSGVGPSKDDVLAAVEAADLDVDAPHERL